MDSEAALLAYDFFADDKDGDGVRNHSARMVTTRARHECQISNEGRHEMPPGTRARLDEAIVDGRWARFYTCAKCLREEIASQDELCDECGGHCGGDCERRLLGALRGE